jgi:hypothetical protein
VTLAHYKTAAYALGTAARYRWGEPGCRETVLHARLGTDPQAQIWIDQPGELTSGGHDRRSSRAGSAMIPRVQQYRALAIVAFESSPPQPGSTRAWFPRPCLDEAMLTRFTALARGGDGLALLRTASPFEAVTEGPSAGCELHLPGGTGRWLLRLGATTQHGSLQAFARRFRRLQQQPQQDGLILVDDPDYGPVEFHPDGTVAAEGRRLNPAEWTMEGSRSETEPPN